MKFEEALTFDDVLLVPQYSEVGSRSQVDLSVDFGKGIKLGVPIISSNMKDVTEWQMARKMAELGGMGIIHRFNTTEEQIEQFRLATEGHEVSWDDIFSKNHVGCAVGIQVEDLDRVSKLVKAGCRILCVDVAHGHHRRVGDILNWIHREFPDVLLIAGNVATKEGANFLHRNGADVVKAGIGGGSICSTRLETGNGVPALTTLQWIWDLDLPYKVICDGGVRQGGDLTKALVFSDAVMLGSLLAGTDESPGEIVQDGNGVLFKRYRGSSTHKSSHIEGVESFVPMKGPVEKTVQKLTEGLRSGCSYQGVGSLDELKMRAKFVRITNAGLVESGPHSNLRGL